MKIEFVKKYFWFKSRNMHPSIKNSYTVSLISENYIECSSTLYSRTNRDGSEITNTHKDGSAIFSNFFLNKPALILVP